MKEIFKDIEGYEGLYQVSNLGRIRSLDAFVKQRYDYRIRKGRILIQHPNNHGYMIVQLSKNSKIKSVTVHRLVAEAFIPNPYNLPEVNHKDENKKNNRVDNLEWCTHDYNKKYGTGLKRMGLGHSLPINQFTLNNELIANFSSSYEVKRKLGFDDAYIRHCCSGKYKTAYGYIWKWANKYQ